MGMVMLGLDKDGKLVEVEPTFRKSTRRESIYSWYVVNIFAGTYICLFFRDHCWWFLYKMVSKLLDISTAIQRVLFVPTILKWILRLDEFGCEINKENNHAKASYN